MPPSTSSSQSSPRPEGADLLQHVLHEGLPAEARLHGHHQHHGALVQEGQGRLRGGLGLEHYARPFAQGPDPLQGEAGVLLRVRLHMDGDDIRPRLAEVLHIAHRAVDHQVDIQRQGRDSPDGLHYRDADGDVGHEQAVHHVHMEVVGAGDPADIPLQICKICGKDGWGNLDHGETSLFSRFSPETGRTGPPLRSGTKHPGAGSVIGYRERRSVRACPSPTERMRRITGVRRDAKPAPEGGGLYAGLQAPARARANTARAAASRTGAV